MKIRKNFMLDEKVIKILDRVKKEKGFASQTAALEYIVYKFESEDCSGQEQIIDQIISEFDNKYKKLLTRIRLASTTADRNIEVILEILNTIVSYSYPQDVLQPMDISKAPMVSQAQEEVKRKIAYYKQLKDNKPKKS